MTQDTEQAPALPRVATGISGLDEVTGGGFLKAGVYIVQGSPGAAKTILANQIAHGHAARGGSAVYVTLLAESHARLMQHMQSFSFFDLSALPERVYYVSAFNALKEGGLPAVVKLLRGEIRARSAGVLVLDGLVMAASAATSEEELKLFVSDVQAHSTLTGCTTLLLTSDDADHPVSAEHTMVDGIVLMRESAYGAYRERNLEAVKFRGSRTLRGNHSFQIGPDGIVVYPRLEAARRQSPGDAVVPVAVSSGIDSVDRLFDIGGFPKGSITAVCGPSGAGKTSMGLHFVARASGQQRALYMGFYESPEFLARIGGMLGLDPAGTLSSPSVDYLWAPFGDNLLDSLAAQLFDRLDSTGATRLVIDGLGGFQAAPTYQARRAGFLTALANELRRRQVTTLITIEEPSPDGRVPLEAGGLSALSDTVVNIRVTEDDAVRRFAWIGKCRASRCDLRVREVLLGPTGLHLREESSVAP